MSDSILTTVKKLLNIPSDYDVFDVDVMTHINSAFSTLNQLGIGPSGGFMISDESAEWSDFLDGEIRLNCVKSYVHLRVKLLFDPPGNSFAVTAIKEQISELEWRVREFREEGEWMEPKSS